MKRIVAPETSPRSLIAKYWLALGAGALAVALLAFATHPTSRDAAAQVGPCPFTIDFAGLPAGTILDDEYAAQGVNISAVANGPGADALIVFDTNTTRNDQDADLKIGIGNIAMIALNTTDSNGDTLVDVPDENNVGGIATFAFDHDVSIGSIKWIDKDHVADNFVIAYNAAGDVITSVPVPLGTNSSVQTIPINADGVRRLVFDYDESGGFTGIEVDCQNPTPSPTAQADTPTPTEPVPTPSPTEAPTATPSPTPQAATATPPIATSTAAPPTDAPSPAPGVAAAAGAPNTGTSTGTGPGAEALPAGGGTPSPADGFRWTAALMALALILGATYVSRRSERH